MARERRPLRVRRRRRVALLTDGEIMLALPAVSSGSHEVVWRAAGPEVVETCV